MANTTGYKLRSYPLDFIVNVSSVMPVLALWLIKKCLGLSLLIGMAMLSYFTVTHFLFQSIEIDGISMSPTLYNTGCYWLSRLSYVRSEPQGGDIVAIKDPTDGTLIVKRIIATPGQSVYLYHGKVFVNNHLLTEPYLARKTRTFALEKNESEFFIVGKDEYFVLGDNRNYSTDSRSFGAVPRANILGRVLE